MAIGYGQPVPKPEPLKRTKARADRQDAAKLKTWRDAIWAREGKKWSGLWATDWSGDRACCQVCNTIVYRCTDAITGECHHRIGRRAKATRYDSDNGVLLCARCHGKVTRHEIEL